MQPIVLLMCLVLQVAVGGVQGAQKTVQARKTEAPPIIDGFLDESWTTADSATGFVQRSPDWGFPPTENTVVYLLYTDRDLYVAFRCNDAHPEQIDTRPGQRDYPEGDEVKVIVDTFDDDLTAYAFGVSAANIQEDSYRSADGTSEEQGWNGVWFSAVQRMNDGYTVELQIPFKTLSFKAGLTEWGIDFQRFISRKREEDSWSVHYQSGFRISQMGRVLELHPPRRGFSLRGSSIESYPVGLVRWENGSASYEGGMEVSWKLASATQALLALRPDFAQVEADPYRVNLGQYSLYYDERRPFFVEGAEIFATPLRLFYSRTVGKGLPDGQRVPILAALKTTGKHARWTAGVIGAWTERQIYAGGEEPASGYYVLRTKRMLWENSELGILVAGKRWKGSDTGVSGVDGALRKGFSSGQVSVGYQLAHSTLEGTRGGYMGKMNISCEIRALRIAGAYARQGVHFDISQIGFEPQKGTAQANVNVEYASPKSWGPFKSFSGSWGVSTYQEDIWPYFQRIHIGPTFSGTFRNNWWVQSQVAFQRRKEMGRWYTNWFTENHFNTDLAKPFSVGDVGFWYHRERYNWRRGYVARQAASWGAVTYRPYPQLTVGVRGTTTVEWRPDGHLEHVSWVWHPTVNWRVVKDVYVGWWNEVNQDLDLHRTNLLVSWNVRPKSWVYLAFNESLYASGDQLEFRDHILVTKVRWLFAI